MSEQCSHTDLIVRVVALEENLAAFKRLMKERDRHYKEALTLANNQSKAIWSYIIAVASMVIAALAVYWRHL